MLLKLIKYEFKSTGTSFLTAIAVYAVMVVVLLLFFSNYVGVTLSLIVAGLFALWVMLFVMIIFQRYNGNLYGSEGYLMLTLPVSSKKLLLSKLFTACVWIVALGLVSVVTIFTIAYREGNIHLSGDTFDITFNHMVDSIPALIQIADSIISGVISVYFAVTISKLPVWRRLGVLVGVIGYFAASMLHSVPSMIFGRTDARGVDVGAALFFSQMTATETWKICVQVGYDAVLCVCFFFLISWLIDKRTNLA